MTAGGAISGDAGAVVLGEVAGGSLGRTGADAESGAFAVTAVSVRGRSAPADFAAPAVAPLMATFTGALTLAGVAGVTGAGLAGVGALSLATGFDASAPDFAFGAAFRDFADALPAGFAPAFGATALLSPASGVLTDGLAVLSVTGFTPALTGSTPLPGFWAAVTGLEGVFESLLMGLILLS